MIGAGDLSQHGRELQAVTQGELMRQGEYGLGDEVPRKSELVAQLEKVAHQVAGEKPLMEPGCRRIGIHDWSLQARNPAGNPQELQAALVAASNPSLRSKREIDSARAV